MFIFLSAFDQMIHYLLEDKQMIMYEKAISELFTHLSNILKLSYLWKTQVFLLF